MNIRGMIRNWTKWGEIDPLWAILSDPKKRGNKWDSEEFFDTGRKKVEEDMEWLAQRGLRLHFGKALDFGCGVGRLTRALSSYFTEVHGVDISPSMIDKAKQLCEGRCGKITFYLIDKGDLSFFAYGTYDFVYSYLTLQHIPTHLQEQYIADFFRILKPGGTALFQTIQRHGWRSMVPNSIAEAYRVLKHRGRPFLPMYGISPKTIASLAQLKNCRIAEISSSPVRGLESRFIRDTYCILKEDAQSVKLG